MDATMTINAALEEAGRLIVDAKIGERLGLETADLKVGLEVAKSFLDRGAPEKAMQIYVALVLCQPTVAEFQIGLANCALRMDEYYVAMQAASAVIAMEPANPRGYFLSGRACMALGLNDEAIEDFTEAAKFAKLSNDRLIIGEAERLLATLRNVAS